MNLQKDIVFIDSNRLLIELSLISWILGLGVAFHLSILITMKVFIFTEVMILLYLCFLREKEVEGCVERIKKVAAGLRAFCSKKENQKIA